MLARPHSPTVWGLYAGAATFAGMLAVTLVWNQAELRRWLRV